MKTMIREFAAMLIIVSAIALIIVLVFFDYIKEDANQPQAAIYETSREEKMILDEKKKYEEDKETLTLNTGYTIDESDLSSLKASGEFKQGQSSPFAETQVTDILYDREGNVYYQTTDPAANTTNTVTNNNNNKNNNSNNNKNNVNTNTNTNTDNKVNNKNTNTNSDLTSPSEGTGSLMPATKSGDQKK